MLNKLFAALMTLVMLLGTSANTAHTVESAYPNNDPTTVQASVPHESPLDSTAQNTRSEKIAAAYAEEMILAELGLTRDQVNFDRTELDHEKGKRVWEVELYHNYTEYDFLIDAETGAILHREAESKNNKPLPNVTPDTAPVPVEITKDQALEIALDHARLTAEDITRLKIEKDRDDGVYLYEIEFNHGRIEYEYEVLIADGKIKQWDKELDD